MGTSTVSRGTRIQVRVARAAMMLTGAWTAYIGYTLLTTAMAIPLTVGLWLVAAAILALGARGKIEQGWPWLNADGLADDRW